MTSSKAEEATVAESPFRDARTGDVFLMNRKCLAMKNPLAIGLCLLTKTENRFDHVGMLVKISEEDFAHFPEARKRIVDVSPSDTYVLETNMKGVTLYAAERRVERSSANELATRTVEISTGGGLMEPGRPLSESASDQLNHRLLRILEDMYSFPYQDDVLAILPSVFSPPDKIDRVDAAYKINQLRMEVESLRSDARGADAKHAAAYGALMSAYESAQGRMLDIYFPHLARTSPTTAVFDRGHLIIDGANHSPKVVCTELIGNLWLRAGITNGFAPASSLRPFDFFDDTRFNFSEPGMRLGDLNVIKSSKRPRSPWRLSGSGGSEGRSGDSGEPAHHASADVSAEERHVAFYNALRASVGWSGKEAVASLDQIPVVNGQAVVPTTWVVQSNDQECVRSLGARLFGSGLLFSFWSVPCAPLLLSWVEGQLGLFLVRGSVWSLACGFFARNVAFVAVQSLTAYSLGALIAARPKQSTPMDVMRTHPASVPSEGVTLSASTTPAVALVDWRHPYYSVVGIAAVSTVLAHMATQPVINGVLSHHFGPLRAGPLPRRLLFKGALSLAPLSLLLPLPGYFLAWYESFGSFIIPTRSSVLRPRQDLLEREDWPHYRNDALAGAFGAMVVGGAVMYPFHTRAARSLVTGLYAPQSSPSFGRRLFPAFRYFLAHNILVGGATCATLSFVFDRL